MGVEIGDGWIEEGGGKGEEVLEEGEERGVVEGPRAGEIGVPLTEWERRGEGKPMAVDLEVSAVVAGNEEELQASHHGEEPWEVRHGDGAGEPEMVAAAAEIDEFAGTRGIRGTKKRMCFLCLDSLNI